MMRQISSKFEYLLSVKTTPKPQQMIENCLGLGWELGLGLGRRGV